MANTTNFGWETPDDTDLVKDGAAAIRTLGSAIDTSLMDLEGGTTGQILAKNSNTDMDFIWVTNDVGDITEVVAGTGISGGGTSGSVTITNTVATEFDAKGDLVVGTGADTFDKLTVGANDTVLVADSSTATGLKWAAPAAGGGKVLQVVSAATSTQASLTSTSYADTGITATITPTLATSKILVLISATYLSYRDTTGTVVQTKAQILRGATQIYENLIATQIEGASAGTMYTGSTAGYTYLDSPATTSATTYKLQAARNLGVGVFYQQGGTNTSTITLLEIGV
jgi:hypothetical protein